jgi:hypothetical protein
MMDVTKVTKYDDEERGATGIGASGPYTSFEA